MMYRAVMNPAFPAVVWAIPTCWRLLATPMMTPQHSPAFTVTASGRSRCHRLPWRTPPKASTTGTSTPVARRFRAALKVKGPT